MGDTEYSGLQKKIFIIVVFLCGSLFGFYAGTASETDQIAYDVTSISTVPPSTQIPTQIPTEITTQTQIKELVLQNELQQKFLNLFAHPRFVTRPRWGGHDGLTMSMYNFVRLWFFAAYVHNRTLLIPPLNKAYNEYEPIPAEDLFDLEAMNEPFLPRIIVYPLSKVPSSWQPSRVVNDVKELDSADEYLMLHDFKPDFDIFALDHQFNWLNIWKPSKKIQNMVNKVVKNMGTEDFVCLHVRIEEDFKEYFHGNKPEYYNLTEILTKIGISKNGTLVKDSVYLAGNLPNNTVKLVRDSGLFKNVFIKDELLPPGPESASYRSIDGPPQTLAAELEYEVCRRGKSFIGNNRSSWSERVYNSFRLSGTANKTAQINDTNGKFGPIISPFCAMNHVVYGIDCVL